MPHGRYIMPQNDTKLEVGVINCLYINNLTNKLVIRNAKVAGSTPVTGTIKINKLNYFSIQKTSILAIQLYLGLPELHLK